MGGCGEAQINIQNSSNVDVYGNKIDMTGANGIALIQQNRGTGSYGPWVTTNNSVHDNIIVSHDATGVSGGAGDYNMASMLNGNTWTNNHYFMADVGNRFWWADTYNFAGFKNATHETGSVSQSYPNENDWLNLPSGGPGN